VGRRRAIVSWIQARNGAAEPRGAEFGREEWQRVRVPQRAAVAMQTEVAAASGGTASVARTTQAHARLILHVVRISATGQVSAGQDLSSPPHPVNEFATAGGSHQPAVAWRESDSTSAPWGAETLRTRFRTWSDPVATAERKQDARRDVTWRRSRHERRAQASPHSQGERQAA
jgi:hypothetical protein